MKTLERYRILRPLGGGAARGVFLVSDLITGGAPVALKRIRAGADALLRASFEREFSVLASLAVPGVGRVRDFGFATATADEPGGPFFTRDYVEGRPLDEVLQGASVAQKVSAVAAVAQVIWTLHRRGIIHGDLKPGNILVSDGGEVHVIDFGLACVPTDRSTSSAGTLPFMAPELLRDGAPSARADVYALAATLWSLVAGAMPFASLGSKATAARLGGERPAVDSSLPADAQRVLTALVLCLSADPAERPPTMHEFAEVVARAAGVPTVSAREGFVAPRPVGHSDLLSQVEASIAKRQVGASDGEAVTVVEGSARGGKSTLLRELKWRLQVRGVRVVTVDAAAQELLAPMASLIRQLALFADPAAPLREGELSVSSLSDDGLGDRLRDLLVAAQARGPLVVFVDDLDLAEPQLAQVLRAAVHSEGAERVAVVASATDTGAPGVVDMGQHERLSLRHLDAADVAKLVRESLGAVDVGVATRLFERTAGLPGAIVDLLSALATRDAPTAADVAELDDAAGGAQADGRLRGLSEPALRGLSALSLVGEAVPWAVVARVAGLAGTEVAAALAELVGTGTVEVSDGGDVRANASIAALARHGSAQADVQSRAKAFLAPKAGVTLSATARLRLACASGDGALVRSAFPAAALALTEVSAHRAHVLAIDGALPFLAADEALVQRLVRADLQHGLGAYAAAQADAESVLHDAKASPALRARAGHRAAEAAFERGELPTALRILNDLRASAEGSSPAALGLLARVHLRRGEYPEVMLAADAGLAIAGPHDPARIDLLSASGMAAAYAADHRTATERFHEALLLARSLGSKRDEASVLTYMAIDRHRAGEHRAARDLYTQSLDIARELSDIGRMSTFAMNLGTIAVTLGDHAVAREHYEAAARLARRAGKTSTAVMARANLANLLVYLGLYERAKRECDAALHEAQDAGLQLAAAQTTALLGDVAGRTGDMELALVRYDDAIAQYRAIQHPREVAEVLLDAASLLLDRGGPMDLSAAAARLAEARTTIDTHRLDEQRLPLRLHLARARGETGDQAGALEELSAVLAAARQNAEREIEWMCLYAIARQHASMGGDFHARRHDQQAMEVLESIAMRLPRDEREAFWHDPRRRAVRERLSSPRAEAAPAAFVAAGIASRTARLLDMIKRLASEQDMERLLERITDCAVELSGAERGFVLMVGADGTLEAKTARDARTGDTDPHILFSKSIAESVLIDGRPIITVDARDDQRVSEFMSVHKLMLKSVACLPIRGRSGTVGVLYLEHRLRRGRFEEADIDLLFALADQAAIAVENARLLEENIARRAELEAANEELSIAKAQLERVLMAKTTQLEDTKRELSRVRTEVVGSGGRHGLVGRSEAMRRVFSVIDRVSKSDVSVVIHGESGTGKELVARAIHDASGRAEGPFVALNCGAVPEALIESELFGHMKGSFTGADRDRDGVVVQASSGTLFLDEVGDMPPKMQVDLLRVLQEGKVRPVGAQREHPVSVRIVAASNKSLAELVAQGKFREDLFYRLNVVQIDLPALRQRRGDMALLADHLLQKIAEQTKTSPRRLAKDALERLETHPFPGNVRQLEHVLMSASVMVAADVITAADLVLDRTAPSPGAGSSRADAEATPKNLKDWKDDEKRKILSALEDHGWNRARAAEALGIPRRTFYRRLREYGVLAEGEE